MKRRKREKKQAQKSKAKIEQMGGNEFKTMIATAHFGLQAEWSCETCADLAAGNCVGRGFWGDDDVETCLDALVALPGNVASWMREDGSGLGAHLVWHEGHNHRSHTHLMGNDLELLGKMRESMDFEGYGEVVVERWHDVPKTSA